MQDSINLFKSGNPGGICPMCMSSLILSSNKYNLAFVRTTNDTKCDKSKFGLLLESHTINDHANQFIVKNQNTFSSD